jgi:hypothetical protein
MSAIDVVQLFDDDADMSFLLAWGVHQPSAFLRAVKDFGYNEKGEHRVQHLRFLVLRRNPNTGRFQRWYEPVQGEPNATVVYLD